jgi:uncharacterized protein YjbI with pentapeptide repeats
MLIRNSEGDYSPAHRSLLEFFVAYKIVASLGAMAADFTEVAQQQSYLDESLASQDYTWENYFRRECDDNGDPKPIAGLKQFKGQELDRLLSLLSHTKLTKAVLDLAHPMLDDTTMKARLLPLIQATAKKTLKEISYLGGNVVQLMLAKTPYAMSDADLGGTKLQGIDFTEALLRRVSLMHAQLAETSFSKALAGIYSIGYSLKGDHGRI